MLEDNLSPKMTFDDNNNNTDDNVFYEDDQLAIATQACIQTGTFLPLLKEELKCKILAKCHEEGKEIKNEPERKMPQPRKRLQPDEEKRLEKRREQNRRAAKKFRERKRSETDKLEQVTSDLESQNENLRGEIHRLSSELTELNALWESHICVAHPSVFDTLGVLDNS